jgi:cytochrome c553
MRVFTGFAGLMALVYASIAPAAAPVPSPKPDLERGRQIAATACAACHGADGRGTASANPHLAAQHGDYIAAQLAAFKSGARSNPIMQGMATPLSPEDMRNVGAHFASQKPVEGAARDKDLALRGQQIWRSGIKATGVPACAGCHGAAGHGIPAQYPRLAGQWPELSFAWLKAYATGARPHAVMGPLAAKLSENDMRALSEFISGVR